MAVIRDGELVLNGQIYDDGDCLEWFDKIVKLPEPPLFVFEQLLTGQCAVCEHPICWLLVEIAVIPVDVIDPRARIGEYDWLASGYRFEEPEADDPWRWFSARLSFGPRHGVRNWIGPFSVAASVIGNPDGSGFYHLFRNVLDRYWDRMLVNALQQLLMTGSNQND
ncbi:MAG: hypothetical protein ABIW82_16790 [Dokdonella sp.]